MGSISPLSRARVAGRSWPDPTEPTLEVECATVGQRRIAGVVVGRHERIDVVALAGDVLGRPDQTDRLHHAAVVAVEHGADSSVLLVPARVRVIAAGRDLVLHATTAAADVVVEQHWAATRVGVPHRAHLPALDAAVVAAHTDHPYRLAGSAVATDRVGSRCLLGDLDVLAA